MTLWRCDCCVEYQLAKAKVLIGCYTCRKNIASRSFRVGWGANGQLAAIRGSNRVVVSRIAVPEAAPLATVHALLDAHRRASDCLAVAGGDGGPLWQLVDAREFVRDVVTSRTSPSCGASSTRCGATTCRAAAL